MKMKSFCLVIALIALIALTSCGHNQATTQPSEGNQNTAPTETVQNTAQEHFVASCNLNAGGYVNFLNGKYYYVDAENNDSLFMSDSDGKNAVCIDACTDSKISSITVDETAVYYLKSTKLDAPLEIGDYSILYEKQIRRFCDGNVTVLSEGNVLSYALSKDYIFYTAADLKVYRMRHDGTEKTAILELSNPMSLFVSENKLYAHGDEAVISTDFDGKNPLTRRVYLFAPAVNETTMYFINTNGCSLCKTDLNGDNLQPVINEAVRSFTVYNGRLVYEKMDTGEIVIADMNGENPKVVCTGTSPIALNGYLFYLDNGNIRVADI